MTRKKRGCGGNTSMCDQYLSFAGS